MVNGGPTEAEVIREYEELEKQHEEYLAKMVDDPLLNWFEQLNVYTDPVVARPMATNTVSIKSLMDPIEGADVFGFIGEFVLPLVGLYEGHRLGTEALYKRVKKEIGIELLKGKKAQEAAERAGPQAGPRYEEQMGQLVGEIRRLKMDNALKGLAYGDGKTPDEIEDMRDSFGGEFYDAALFSARHNGIPVHQRAINYFMAKDMRQATA